ncbi:MAG TPA: hypothetical protein VG714_03645 [Acidobacteriaceae bacterium]|nr:hypothetical protein [Acidobacteriaceae bacterium]
MIATNLRRKPGLATLKWPSLGALKGRGFSRAVTPQKIRRALAPEGSPFKLSLIFALTLISLSASAQQQTLRIRLLDGKSGKALTPTSIRVATTPAETPRYLIPAADPSSVLVYLKAAQSFTVSQQFVRCDVAQKPAPNTPAPAPATYSVADILAHGLVSANNCAGPKSKLTPAAPKPGELTLYVRKATPCELSKEHINGINFCN